MHSWMFRLLLLAALTSGVLYGCEKTCIAPALLEEGRCVVQRNAGPQCHDVTECSDGEVCSGGHCERGECAETQPCISSEFSCVDNRCQFIEPERSPSLVVQTSGSAVMTGSGRQLTIAAGTPTPTGVTASSQHTLYLGPISLQVSQ